MNATQLLAHFDRLAEAPNAVPRLRRFILNLAVRGKLVEQDAGDEPAVELMKRIQSGKAIRIKSGEVRNPRDLTFLESEAPPFLLPPLWNWVRLADVGAIIGGGTPPAGDAANFTDGGKGIGWLTPADLGKHKGLFVSHGIRDLTETGMKAGSATLMPKGSVLFTSRAPIGYVAIAANKISTNQGFKSVVPYLDECSRYIATYLQAFGPQIDSQATGTTFKEVSGKIVSGLPFPLPPLAEQHRIVAKVDELMALCDQLEAVQQERERRRDRLASASLQRLNQPAADTPPEAQREHARFHLHHLPRLTTRPEHIKAMRQTILNLAVSGKLLEQAVDAEPASALLKRLQVDIKSYGVQNRVHPATINAIPDSAPPYLLPGGWIWTRLASLCRVVTDGDHLPPPKSANGVAFLTIGNVSSGALSFANSRYVSQEYFDKITPYRKPELGDILYTVVGASYGRPVLVETDQPFCVQRHIAILKPAADLQLRYLHLLLKSQLVYDQATASLTGTAQPTIPLRPLRNFLVPLPPLAMQHRIVAKVDDLMALCDQLEAQLTIIQTDSGQLLEAVLDAALTPA